MRRFSGLARGVAGVLLLGLCSLAAHGQEITGSISGTVTDPSGATVKGATVTLTSVERGQDLRTLTTNGAGFYTGTSLPIGTYTVKIVAGGFKTDTVTELVLHVNDALTVSRRLEVGSSDQVISVNADQLQLNLENATVSGLINGTQVKELILNNRNYEQLVALMPGVVYGGVSDQLYIGNSLPGGTTATVAFSINGGRSSTNNWTIDGTTNVDRGSNLTLLSYPSIDAIAEFKVLRNTYTAEFGGSASGQINVITRSGSNDFHGTLYEFFRNNVLNANAYFNKTTSPFVARPLLRYNDFGGTIGGPVRIPGLYNGSDKTFFFFSGEYRRVITYSSTTLTGVPTAAERTGNFGSNAVCTSVTIVSASSAKCATTGTQVTNISPIAAAYIKDVFSVDGSKVPLPNSLIDAHTLIANQRSVYNENQEIARIDHSIGKRLTVTGRMIYDEVPTVEPGGAFTNSTSLPGAGNTVNQSHTNSPGHNYLGRLTFAATPRLVIEGGYSYSYGGILSTPTGYIAQATSPDIQPVLPYTATLGVVPLIAMTGATSLTSSGRYDVLSKDNNVFVQVTKTLGGHTLITGATFDRYFKTENATSSNAGTFGFTSVLAPAGTTAANYQQSFANFLSGYAATFSQASEAITPALHSNLLEAYVQDNWKATRSLAINAGVRYTYFGQPTDSSNQLDNFDPGTYVAANAPTIDNNGQECFAGSACVGGVTPNPTYDRLNGIILATPGSFGHATAYGGKIGRQHNLNFGPRVGFALDVFGDQRTVLRGGYGISFDSSLYGTYEQNTFANPPYVLTSAYTNVHFDNPAGSSPNTLATPSPAALHATATDFKTPYSQQFSLGFQTQPMKDMTVSADYVGEHSVHLLGIIDLNEAAPGAFAQAPLNLSVATTTFNSGGSELVLNRIRPYKGYNAINSVQNVFGSNYNSLQVQVQKRFQHSSLVDVNYTWSHALTDMQTDRSTAVQDRTNLHGEYGRSQYDRKHVLTADFVYAVPFFYDQKGFAGHVLGGWELSGIWAVNSGLPFTATTSNLDPGGLGFLGASSAGGRPDVVSNPNVGTGLKTRQRWFATEAFARVPSGQARPGNEPRGAINGPGFQRWDLGMLRNFKLGETSHNRFDLQFRAESFNTFNHTNWATINVASFTSATAAPATTFGTVTAARDNRILQVAMKLNY